jgi:hypothetical protein
MAPSNPGRQWLETSVIQPRQIASGTGESDELRLSLSTCSVQPEVTLHQDPKVVEHQQQDHNPRQDGEDDTHRSARSNETTHRYLSQACANTC